MASPGSVKVASSLVASGLILLTATFLLFLAINLLLIASMFIFSDFQPEIGPRIAGSLVVLGGGLLSGVLGVLCGYRGIRDILDAGQVPRDEK